MHRWTFAPLLLAAAAVALADGPAAPAAPPAPTAPPAVPATAPADPVRGLAERVKYVPVPFEMDVADPVPFGDSLVVEKLTYPSAVKSVDPGRNDTVRGKLFRTASPEAALLVCLGGWRHDPATPALGAKIAAETGIQVFSMDLPFQGERTPAGRRPGELTFSDDIEQNHATFVQAAQDVARAVDWFVRERKIPADRIGILGTSLGGYIAADLYGLDDRFRCAVIQIAGGDVASVVFNGNFLTQRVRARFVERGIAEKDVREQMRALDPSSWARKERKDDILLIAAELDEVVPLPTVEALAKAYGGAKLVLMKGARHIDPKQLEAHLPHAIEHIRARLLPDAAKTDPKKTGTKNAEPEPATK